MYIVTGGAGFIGSAMIWKLNQMGIDDILVVDNLASTDKWKNLVNLRYTDYLHRDRFLKMVAGEGDPFGVKGIVHMGACSSTTEKDADFLMENNTRYTQVLCRFALSHGARFLNASSAATYGGGEHGFKDDHAGLHMLKPLNMYGYSKHLFDLWAQRAGVLDQIASIKFFNVFGPNAVSPSISASQAVSSPNNTIRTIHFFFNIVQIILRLTGLATKASW